MRQKRFVYHTVGFLAQKWGRHKIDKRDDKRIFLHHKALKKDFASKAFSKKEIKNKK